MQNLSKYQVGDTVWHARCDFLPIKKPCPVCFGERQVTLILGNGDHVALPCDYCHVGFNPPTGQVSEYEYVIEPKLVNITAVELKVTETTVKAEYRDRCFVYRDDTLFPTKEEAAVKGAELKAALEKEQETRADLIKKNVHKKFSWNAGYHLREAKRDRASAERHEKLAALCKARSQEKEGER